MTRKTIFVFFALCLMLQVQAGTLLGNVINVADGDTITVLDADKVQHKIRLAGIDAPEKSRHSANAPSKAQAT